MGGSRLGLPGAERLRVVLCSRRPARPQALPPQPLTTPAPPPPPSQPPPPPLQKREPGFPYNLEPLLLGRELRLPRGRARRALTLKLAMRQLLEALRDCHATGIVHRDFKPQNCIVSATARRVKLIDFGAAADLRLGINYVPNEYLLDPRCARRFFSRFFALEAAPSFRRSQGVAGAAGGGAARTPRLDARNASDGPA